MAATVVPTTVSSTRARRGVSPRLAGFTYVGAWVAGLTAFGAGPAADAGDAEVARYFADHRLASGLQSLLIHGVAAAALLVVLVALHRSGRSTRLSHRAGIAGVALSFLQLGLDLWRSAWSTGSTTVDLVTAIDRVDGLKMLAFAVMIGAAVRAFRSSGLIGTKMAVVGWTATAALVLSGLGYATGAAALMGAAFLSLPLLLTWVGVAGARAR